MSAEIKLLSDFNGDQVIKHFNLSSTHTLEHAAMIFMYRQIREEMAGAFPDNAQKHKEIIDLTIEEIQFRFDLYNVLSADFFFDDKINHASLSLAIICGQYIEHINAPCHDSFENDVIDRPVRFHDDGIDEDTLTEALLMFEDARTLLEYGQPPIINVMSPESLFLAHIKAMEKLRNIESGDEEVEDVTTLLDEELPRLRTILRLETELGRKLGDFIDHIEALYKPSPPPKPRPALFIVPSSPAP